MKRITFIGLLMVILTLQARAQEYSLYDNYIKKGTFAVNASVVRSHKNVIQKGQYRSDGLEVGATYYLFDKVAIKSGLSGMQFNKLGNQIGGQINEEHKYDKDHLVQVSSQFRYHFYDQPHCATMFIQTGYRFGKFNESREKIKAWEIASFGVSTHLLRKIFTNLAWEGTGGVLKDNFHDKPVISWQLGLNYYFGI